MPKHEFAMMPNEPEKGKSYEEYESQKFACISVDDEALESVAEMLGEIDFYHHAVDVPKKGLAWCGITLIPPSALKDFIKAIEESNELDKLKALLETAQMFGKWVIHFGI